MSRPFCTYGPDSGAMKPTRIGPTAAGCTAPEGATRVPTATSSTINKPGTVIVPSACSPAIVRGSRSASIVPQPLRGAEHRHDVDRAEDQQPSLRVGADHVLQQHDRSRPEHRAYQRSRTSERNHQEQ